MFNVVHKNVRGGSNDKYPVGDFQKIPLNDFHENDYGRYYEMHQKACER